MPCQIRLSETNQPIGVYDKNGNPSKLFNSIISNPHIDFNQAVNIYTNVYDAEENPLEYRDTTGNIYQSFRDVIKNTNDSVVKAFLGDVELFSINTDSTTKDYNGLLNNLVKSDLLSGESYMDIDGNKIFKVIGNSEYKQHITSDMAINTARGVVGYAAKRTTGGELYFDENLIGKRVILDKNNNPTYLSQQQLDAKSYNSLKATTSDPIGIMGERAYKENNRAFGDVKPIEEIEIVPDNVLQDRFKKLLTDLGVKTVAIDSIDGANALADISNKVIVFSQGNITQEDLSEEVSHFIVEATDTSEIENLLRNVHKTPEWTQYADAYRDVYNDDNLLRKEILGKVLSNSIQNNFAQESESATNNSIIARLQEIFNGFFERIAAFFKPLYQQQLDSYTKSVYDNLMADSLYEELNEEQLDGKKFTLYSLSQNGTPQEYKNLERAISGLSDQQYALQKKYTAPANQNMLKEAKENLLKAIASTDEDIQAKSLQKALLNVATTAENQINYLTSVVNKNENKGFHFAQEENSVFQNFNTKIEPLLSQLSNKLNSKNRAEKNIKDKINTVLNKSIELKGKIPNNNKVALENIVNRVVLKNNLTGSEEERFRKELTNVLEASNKDTAWFHAHLGQLAHAQNILLNLAGDVIAKTVTESRTPFLQQMKGLLNKLEAINFDPRKLSTLSDGNGYIISEYDFKALEDLDAREQSEIYNDITGSNVNPEDFKRELIDAMSTEDRQLYTEIWGQNVKDRLESFFTKEHQDKLDNTFVEVDGEQIYRRNLPRIALDYDAQYRGQLAQIRANNGGINTASDVAQIEELNRERAEKANPRNADGSFKPGITEIYNAELQAYEVRLNLSTAKSDEDILDAQQVYGLNLINQLNKKFYEGSERQQDIPQSFIDKLEEFETEQEKWDFVQLNSYVGFKPDYWENFGQNESLAERLSDAKDGENDGEIDELLSDLRTQQQIISQVLRGRRKYNQPSETNVAAMTDIEKSAIKDATIQLESLYSKANTYLGETEAAEPFSQTRLNAAFQQDLEDENITSQSEIINHIQKNVTPKNRAAIDKAIKVVNRIKNGEEIFIDKSLQRVFNEEMTVEEAEQALMRFAESKLLPYYKRTEPVGYSEERNSLQEGLNNSTPGAVEEFIKNTQYTQISPSYSFYGQTDVINPTWLANKEAKRPQYTSEFAEKIKNKDYYNRFGINENGEPTRNLEEWQARQALLDLQDWTIDNYGLTGRHNRYLLPQMRKSQLKRATEFLSTKGSLDNIRQSLTDLVNFREDETERGQDESGNVVTNNSTILSIPTYGAKRIEQQDVTDELLYSYAWMAQQSSLHRARKNNIGDMLVIQDAVLNGDYAGKSAESTNTYKMFKSFLNSSFYGSNQTFSYEVNLFGKKVNLGKLAKTFNNWVRYVNLTGISVPLTSYIQSSVQQRVENLVGQTSNPIAAKLARKEFFKHASAAGMEVLGFNSKAKMNVLGEAYGVYDLVEGRFENSTYNKSLRGIAQASSAMHSLGNFPVLPRVMLQSLYDNRYYNGQIISYNQFLRKNNTVKSSKDILARWESLPLLYDDISTIGGIQSYDKASISQKTGWVGEELDRRVALLHESLTNRVSSAIQDIDAQIRPEDKSLASRDARASFLLLHRNFLLLALQQRFKSSHYDISRQTFSEGSWITTGKFIRDVTVHPKKFLETWKSAMDDEVKRRNLKRTVLDIGVANALAVAALALGNYVDDDDDPLYPVAFADYFVTRVANEQLSATVTLPNQLGQVVQDPIVALDRFYALFDVTDLFSSEEVTRGNFAGDTKSWKYLSQNMAWIKDYNRLSNPKVSAQTYRYFNKDIEDYSIASIFLSDEEETEK